MVVVYVLAMGPFETGLQARLQGEQLEQNPFKAGTASWLEWRRGWLVSSSSGRLPRLTQPLKADQATTGSPPNAERQQ